jgi:hypothetical protein
MKRNTRRALCAVLLGATVALCFAGSASAKLTGDYTVFQQCPWTNAEARRCLYAVTEGGEFVLGNKKVPIVNPAVLQAGYTKPTAGFAKLVAAKNGVTLSKAPQPVPGGLAGLVNCKEISNFILKAACEWTFENGLTGVNSTLELAKPPNEVLLSELHLAEEVGVALKMPARVHLENPLLGESCFVGSSSSPITLELTTGETAPPGPNKAIKGSGGVFEFLDENQIIRTKGAELVDNAWSAPTAEGCGGIFSFLIDPIINATVGLPASAGVNTAVLKNTITIATAGSVKRNDEENP